MQPKATWIATTDDLVAQLEFVGAGPISLDTEADSFHHYREKVCLVQLSFAGRDLLVDPLAGVDLLPLAPHLANRKLRKILHGADYDLRMLHRDFGLEIRGLFDTMIAARLVGERAFGLSALLARYFEVRLDKRHQRADWSLRPLPAEMADYAVMDTRHLLPLTDRLESKLRDLGREAWAREEFLRLEAVRWADGGDKGEAYLRVKGAQRLDRRELAILRELFELREAEAQRRDVPVFRVVRNDTLIELARAGKQGSGALAAVRGLPRGWTRGAAQQRLIEAAERGTRLSEDALPQRPVRGARRRRPAAEEAALKQLCLERDRLADELDLEPSLVASRGLLERILDRGSEADREVVGLARWQEALLAPVIARLEG